MCIGSIWAVICEILQVPIKFVLRMFNCCLDCVKKPIFLFGALIIGIIASGSSLIYIKRNEEYNSAGTMGNIWEQVTSIFFPWDKDTLSAKISLYPGYENTTSTINPTGRITIRFNNDDETFLVRYELNGLETNCINCFIKVHAGLSCAADSLVGVTYYNPTVLLSDFDPWEIGTAGISSIVGNKQGAVVPPLYTSNEDGYASGSFPAENGFGFYMMIGHTVVVYSNDGKTRIGCGVLRKRRNKGKRLVASIKNYPRSLLSKPNISPSGIVYVDVMDDDNVIKIQIKELIGLEDNCIKCGIHIHQGVSCDNGDTSVGPHYWNQTLLTEDPWAYKSYNSFYTSTSNGTVDKQDDDHKFYIYNGHTFDDLYSRTVVIHSQDGTRIGCGVLKLESEHDAYDEEDNDDGDDEARRRRTSKKKKIKSLLRIQK